MESLEDVRKSLLVALVDRKVNKYVASYDGICGKLEKDRYMIITRKKALRAMQEEHFPITEDVKTVKVGNEMAITISIGFGLDGLTYSQTMGFARNAVDISLGRGGDQVTVKTPEDTIYYGGKTQQVEKSKKVRSRIMAQALKELIRSKDVVFIMGHRLGDPDSFGSAIGVYRIAKTLGKKAHIIINERTTSLSAVLTLFEGNPEYEQDLIITGTEAVETVTDASMLVVVDVNKPGITECPDMLRLCKTVVVLDHHRKGTDYIENTALSYVESYVSSACEMVTELIQYIGDTVRMTSAEADAIYGGIVVDTDNFVNRTGVRTFEASAYLKRNGADATRVRKLFRENAREYKARADVVSQAEIYREQYAISICPADGLTTPTVVGAQAANEMLNIKGIRASFVLTDYNGEIFISARSLDDVNVQRVMERMGGGGHMTIAGCQLRDITVVGAMGSLKKRLIDTMIEEGELYHESYLTGRCQIPGQKRTDRQCERRLCQKYDHSQKLGLEATEKNLNDLKLKQRHEEKLAAQKLQEAKQMASDLEKIKITVAMKAGEGGRVFGSIAAKEIAQAAKDQHGLDLDKKKIQLSDPIKTFGMHEVPIKLHTQVTGRLYVLVQEK